jgi:tetraacyldisaccharide 4'-kinase
MHQVARYAPAGKSILRARIVPALATNVLKGKPVVAFAGIAHPRKFYRTLQEVGCIPKKMVAYPDHYVFKPADIAFLRSKAKEHEAILVTTFKDYVRLPADMRSEVTPVPIEAVFEDNAALLRLVIS